MSGIYIPATVTYIADDAFENDSFLVISTDCTENENENTHPVLKFAKKHGFRHMKFKHHDKGWHGEFGKSNLNGHNGQHGIYWMTDNGWVWFDSAAVGHMKNNSPGDLELEYNNVGKGHKTGHDKQEDTINHVLKSGGCVYDFTLTSNDNDVAFSNGNNGSAEIHVPYAAGKEDVHVYHIDDNGNKTRVKCYYDKESGELSFETTHFSYYSVEAANDVETGDEELDITINAPAEATVNAPAEGWLEGENTFTVSSNKVCRVFVSYDGGQTYTRLTVSAVGNDHGFTADNMTADTILTVLTAGDVSGDGNINIVDISKLCAASLGKTSLSPLYIANADTNGDGNINIVDISKLCAVSLGKSSLNW